MSTRVATERELDHTIKKANDEKGYYIERALLRLVIAAFYAHWQPGEAFGQAIRPTLDACMLYEGEARTRYAYALGCYFNVHAQRAKVRKTRATLGQVRTQQSPGAYRRRPMRGGQYELDLTPPMPRARRP